MTWATSIEEQLQDHRTCGKKTRYIHDMGKGPHIYPCYAGIRSNQRVCFSGPWERGLCLVAGLLDNSAAQDSFKIKRKEKILSNLKQTNCSSSNLKQTLSSLLQVAQNPHRVVRITPRIKVELYKLSYTGTGSILSEF